MPEPNPGSDAAIAAGCTCPVADNNHGEFAPWPPNSWWINESCPIHNLARPSVIDTTATDAVIAKPEEGGD